MSNKKLRPSEQMPSQKLKIPTTLPTGNPLFKIMSNNKLRPRKQMPSPKDEDTNAPYQRDGMKWRYIFPNVIKALVKFYS